MKKIILCLLAFSVLTFVSCNKEEEKNNQNQEQQEPVNPAKDFEGEYTMSGTITLNIPVLGERTAPITDRDVSVTLKGNRGDVTIVSGDYSIEGYVNESGLHVEPIVINYPIDEQHTIALTVTIPTIKKPVDGTTSCQASIAATYSGMTVTGMTDITAVKK